MKEDHNNNKIKADGTIYPKSVLAGRTGWNLFKLHLLIL